MIFCPPSCSTTLSEPPFNLLDQALVSALSLTASNEKGELQCLLLIETRITERLVASGQVCITEPLTASCALRHGITSQLEMDATQEGPQSLVDGKRR